MNLLRYISLRPVPFSSKVLQHFWSVFLGRGLSLHIPLGLLYGGSSLLLRRGRAVWTASLSCRGSCLVKKILGIQSMKVPQGPNGLEKVIMNSAWQYFSPVLHLSGMPWSEQQWQATQHSSRTSETSRDWHFETSLFCLPLLCPFCILLLLIPQGHNIILREIDLGVKHYPERKRLISCKFLHSERLIMNYLAPQITDSFKWSMY